MKCSHIFILSTFFTDYKMVELNLIKLYGMVKGELQPKISLLHMKVITLIKAKCNVFFDTCNAVAAREGRKPKY